MASQGCNFWPHRNAHISVIIQDKLNLTILSGKFFMIEHSWCFLDSFQNKILVFFGSKVGWKKLGKFEEKKLGKKMSRPILRYNSGNFKKKFNCKVVNHKKYIICLKKFLNCLCLPIVTKCYSL